MGDLSRLQNNPLVTVVTPSFNQGRFIRDTIDSVLSQGYPHIEYIVIDGGSTDETVPILKSYDGKFCWVSEPDHGQSDAINKGWLKSTGAILAYLNSDDTYCPDAVATAVNYLVQHPEIAMIHADCCFIDENGSLLKTHEGKQMDFEDVLCWSRHLSQPTVFLRREVIDQVGLINADLHYAMDYDLWIRVASQYRIRHLPVVLANERHYATSKTVASPELGLKGRIQALEHFSTCNRQPDMCSLKRRALAIHCFTLSRYYLGAGDFLAARAYALRSLRSLPPIRLMGINVLVVALSFVPSPRFGMWLRKLAVRFVKNTNTYPYRAG